MQFNCGDIICRKELVYPHGALRVVGHNDKGELLTLMKGGGGQVIVPEKFLCLFRRVTDKEMRAPLYEWGKFRVAGTEPLFEGWAKRDELWNGWAMPRFAQGVCRDILKWLGEDRGWFDPERNAYCTLNLDGDQEIWLSECIGVADGSCLIAYPIGAGSWKWERV